MPFSNTDIKHWGNRYMLLEKIGKGAYGIAYKVKDINGPEGQGSIKVLKEVSVESMEKDEVDECTREGKLLSKLNHPHIVQYFDSFCFKGNYCIITEFCEGGDLDRVITDTKRKGRHLEEQRILRWFIQIMHGLDYIHKRKILHRDLKPRNIFLKSDAAKIGDFGISRILNFTMDLASTFLGTPFYMSPEVLKHDGYNTTSDIWSSGIILFEMCSLKHAYEGKSIMDVMLKILQEPCSKIPSIYNDGFQNVIESILIKDPRQRPSAQEVLEIPYIKKCIKDPWLDIAASLDLSETLVKKETEDISSYMSKSVDLKDLDENTVKLTPKEKLRMKKKIKADQNAEEQKKYVYEIYTENKEVSNYNRQNSLLDSLPFARKRYENSRSSLSEYGESKLSRTLDSKSVNTSSYLSQETIKPLSQTEKIRTHFELESNSDFHNKDYQNKPKNNDVTVRLSTNSQELFTMKYSGFKYDDASNCNVIPYNKDDDPLYKENEPVYSSDFDSEDSGSNLNEDLVNEDEKLNETNMEKFQDDITTDPFGKDIKTKKIFTMTKKCLEKIDETTLNKALKYLENNSNRDYLSGLRKICKSDDVAMTVDQLYFLRTPNTKIF